MVRAILAAIAGFLAIGILLVFTDQITTTLSQGFNSTPGPVRFTLFSFLFGLTTGSSYCFLGGYLCAALAKENARLATLILMLGGELIGSVVVTVFWHSLPHLFAIAMLLIFAACVRAGSNFQRRGNTPAVSLQR